MSRSCVSKSSAFEACNDISIYVYDTKIDYDDQVVAVASCLHPFLMLSSL